MAVYELYNDTVAIQVNSHGAEWKSLKGIKRHGVSVEGRPCILGKNLAGAFSLCGRCEQ